MNKIVRKIALLFLVTVLSLDSFCYANTIAGQEMRTQVLYLLDIIENDNDMNELVKRSEFARMVVKASTFKDATADAISSSVFQDVQSDNIYSSYIKVATREAYMTSYLSGNFKPDDFMTYKDLIRACLALLSYTNEDFIGNQVNGRYQMFCSLRMNENIDKGINDYVTKKDCVNAIYNTLKTNKKGGNTSYGPSVFPKLSVNNDGELNAGGLISTKLEGPYVLKSGEAINLIVPFDINDANIFINGTSAGIDTVARELKNNGYVIYYYNTTTKTIYVYKEGVTLESATTVEKGYINHIYYSAGDTITPTRVEIDLGTYNLGNSEVKFAFSYAGTLHVGDQIIFIYTKNDTDEDSAGVSTDGTITYACLYDLNY